MGCPISLTGRSFGILGDMALWKRGADAHVAFWCSAETLQARLRALHVQAFGFSEDRSSAVGCIYVDPRATLRGKAEEPTPEEPDLRILAVHYERDGRRSRRLQDCQLQYEGAPFDDWPVEGDRSVGHSARELRRADLGWLQHHDNWMRLVGVDANARSAHEHLVICTVFHFPLATTSLCCRTWQAARL